MEDAMTEPKKLDVTQSNQVSDIKTHQRPQIMDYFQWSHLPKGRLQEVSQTFAEQAERIVTMTDVGPEQTVALRKLLESKDAAVRAALPKKDSGDYGSAVAPTGRSIPNN